MGSDFGIFLIGEGLGQLDRNSSYSILNPRFSFFPFELKHKAYSAEGREREVGSLQVMAIEPFFEFYFDSF